MNRVRIVNTVSVFIFNSCSHVGLEAIVSEVREHFQGKGVYAFFGGLHLMKSANVHALGVPKEEVEHLGKMVLQEDIQFIYTGHCTGSPAYEILKTTLLDRLHLLESGVVIDIET